MMALMRAVTDNANLAMESKKFLASYIARTLGASVTWALSSGPPTRRT